MKTNHILTTLVIFAALLLAGCAPKARVGALQTEFQSVELGDSSSVRVEINLGAGDLRVSGSAEKLLEADFNYNVARLKPEVGYTDGTLTVRQPGIKGLPALQSITDYRNEWNLRFNDEVPLELSIDMGAGTSNLQLSGLSLTQLDLSLGAALSTIDLSGNWGRDLDVNIEAGATDITVRLPRDIGVRVKVESGPHTLEASALMKDGEFYTNDAYGVSEVTLNVTIEAGIGHINLEVE